MHIRRVMVAVTACVALLLGTYTAHAQVLTGSITGVVADTSGAVLPGVNVTVSGERLIGGPQTQVTDATGAYRFDRLVPGAYNVKFELQGFKTVDRQDVRLNAGFVATISPKLEVGSLTETITVTGESPTVDVRSNVQQTVMSQEILEGVPTGRDPWSLAKIIPGVQVSTYDVGGTQSMQQSSMSSHGSNTADVSYNIDGATVNWPGGGGGATMLYYDQGMFEEVNYMTSAIPAEVLAGGVSINMVTKAGGNKWSGSLRSNFANNSLQGENWAATQKISPNFLGNPTEETYDVNLAGGGALITNRVWVNGTVRKWVVNKRVNARNPDGSQALDDNDLKNYSGKMVAQVTPNQKVILSYLWNDKIRGHRRDTPPNIVEDVASLVQANPAQTFQAKYTGIRNRLVYESNFSIMDGETKYTYQPDTAAGAIRKVDNARSEAFFAATRQEFQPNSRTQWDNIFSYSASKGGDHLFKGGVQFARLYYESDYSVQGDHYVEYNNGLPAQIRQFNTPVNSKNIAHVLGFFAQDSWTMNRLTLNLGLRYDRYTGILPEQSAPATAFAPARSVAEQNVIEQDIAVWRAGASYDLTGNGSTALKASYSRYGLQTGIDRVTNVNPLTAGSRTCPWTDPNGDGAFQASEVNVATCSAFSGGVSTFYANGVSWPYSDELTAGIEQQLPGAVRVGAMYYYRTNKAQLGVRNEAVPSSAYTPFQLTIPNGPGGTLAAPKPMTVTVYNLAANLASAQNNIRDNQDFLDTTYHGVEFTANKRFSKNWQMVAGLTIGKNTGGVNVAGGQSGTVDLNDPNNTQFTDGIIGSDSLVAFRLSGSYTLPWDVNLAGTLISNSGYPYVSTASVTRAQAAAAGVAMTRATQTVLLSNRGDERLDAVTMLDLRLSKNFRFGNRSISPQVDFFNITNADTATGVNGVVGNTYLFPSEILAPRIIRVGLAINF
ncbi:MAG: TonB-dependent receptor [Acidobacteria bacterium]|nr:TonB-dependent receptor [Acidobacteriota bacterium]